MTTSSSTELIAGRIEATKSDIAKIREHPDYKNLSPMLRAYIDCLAIDAEGLGNLLLIAHKHIGELNEMYDNHLSTH